MIKFHKIAVGISGGVDSAVAALLLKNKGYNVEGIFMKNWDIVDEKGTCTADTDYKDAQYVCDRLNIKLHHVDFVKVYWNEVFCNLVKEYKSGSTPNVDILCNRYVKFDHFYKYAIEKLSMDAIATGHYARTSFGPFLECYDDVKNVKLLMSKDTVKDQTFFLCQVKQNALRRTMFPLGSINKRLVKEIAFKNGLQKIARRKESTGICFIGSRNFQDFISEYIEDKRGKFVDIETGRTVGMHNGIHYWTLGQRCKIGGMLEPYFTVKKDVQENIIYVAMGSKHPALYSNLVFTTKPYWIYAKPKDLIENGIIVCKFRFQHTHDLVDCEVCETSKGLIVKLIKGIRALTEGQYAVFYKNEECLGSAKIVNVGPNNFIYHLLQDKNKNIINYDHLYSSKIKISN